MSHETVDGEEEARVMRSRRIARREGHLPFVPFGLVPLAYGLWVLDPVATILGASISITPVKFDSECQIKRPRPVRPHWAGPRLDGGGKPLF